MGRGYTQYICKIIQNIPAFRAEGFYYLLRMELTDFGYISNRFLSCIDGVVGDIPVKKR
jgi:hypothetical protein